MAWHRFKTGLAVVGGCAALAVVAPPLAGLLNAVGSLTLLILVGYAAYRGWAFMEAIVEASRRPTTVRRNLREGPERAPARTNQRSVPGPEQPEPDPPGVPSRRRRRVWPELLRTSPRERTSLRDR